MSDDINLTYERALQELEEIVAKLEDDGLELAETVRLYERGRMLAQHCQGLLDKVDLRVQQINSGENGELQVQPLSGESAG